MARTIPGALAALPATLEALPDLSLEDLRERWRTLYGSEPPVRLRRGLLVRALAYRLQEQILGGLKPATVRRLKRLAETAGGCRTDASGSAATPVESAAPPRSNPGPNPGPKAAPEQPVRQAIRAAAIIKPGTRLIRQWQGETHEVIVLDQGVRYRGAHYGSLSEVARHITGARWSGPRFFGLTGERHGHP